MSLTIKDISSISAAQWAKINKIRLQSGIFSFEDHEYLLEPMNNKSRRECVMKATQGGFTEKEVLRTFHGQRYGKYPQGVLYLFPTTDVVREFSKSRFNPLILANRTAIGQYVKSGGKGTDTASLKKIGNSFLYLRGARLSQKVGPNADVDESVQTSSIPVDKVVFDEVDKMNMEVRLKALGRMGHSKVKEERYLSNPSVPGFGIDSLFAQSDQRHYWRKCNHCNTRTCAELFFMESAERCVGIRVDGTGYIACQKCGREIFIRDGEWVAMVPGNADYMVGYRWSQLSSVFNDPAEILQQFNDPPEGNLADVYRLRLGLPYISAADKLTMSAVLECCGSDISPTGHCGPCAMGVDVGKIKHIVIGIRTGKDRFEILKVAQLSEWNDIHDLAQRFNVKSAVIDILPYEDEVRRFQKEERYRIFLCRYNENPMHDAVWNNKDMTLSAYRTGIFDATHRIVSEGRMAIPRECPGIKEFAKQLCNAFKVLETNKRTGTSVYRYRGENEHYRNALNYFYLAAAGGKIARVGTPKTRQLTAINEYSRI